MLTMIEEFFQNVGALDAIKVTLLLAFSSTSIATILGVSFGLLLEKYHFPFKKLVIVWKADNKAVRIYREKYKGHIIVFLLKRQEINNKIIIAIKKQVFNIFTCLGIIFSFDYERLIKHTKIWFWSW